MDHRQTLLDRVSQAWAKGQRDAALRLLTDWLSQRGDDPRLLAELIRRQVEAAGPAAAQPLLLRLARALKLLGAKSLALDAGQAEAVALAVSAIDPSTPAPEAPARLCAWVARRLLEEGNPSAAAQLAELAGRGGSASAELSTLRAEALFAQGAHPAALTVIDEALEEFPLHVPLLALGRRLAEAMKREDLLADFCLAHFCAEPWQADLLDRAAPIVAAQGRLAALERAYGQALRHLGEQPRLLNALADLHLRQMGQADRATRFAEAQRLIQRSLELEPRGAMAQQLSERLRLSTGMGGLPASGEAALAKDSSDSGRAMAALSDQLGVSVPAQGAVSGELPRNRLSDLSGRAAMQAIAPPRPMLGRVELRSFLGRGGMGEVWLGRHQALDVDVAVKVMHADPRKGHTSVVRFIREARLAAAIDHQNVVRVLDVGEDAGLIYIVMQYVDGGTVQDRLKAWPKGFPIADALRIAWQTAHALHAASRRDVIHRDIKPANLMMTQDGQVKLADLGLARSVEEGGGDELNTTRAGNGVGTPSYVSPEQIKDCTTVDVRADLYSLGITLYELLTGELPFKANTVHAMVYAQIHTPMPRPSSVRPEVSPHLDGLVLRLAAKDPVDRPQTPRELISELEAIARKQDVDLSEPVLAEAARAS